jgi:catechol 2,3-dioxygenase-like lactoylglutathione lyase family enzyme
MGKSFHIAMFCSEEAFNERQTFYSDTFGAPNYEGTINEGSDGRSYTACIWNKPDGLLFALLRNPDLAGSNEQLAHLGFIFDNRAEFEAEIQRRNIDSEMVATLAQGQRQIFVQDESVPGVEWEISCSTIDS